VPANLAAEKGNQSVKRNWNFRGEFEGAVDLPLLRASILRDAALKHGSSSDERTCARAGIYGRATACAAIVRRQSRHRQSPLSVGIGSRVVSSAHQHGPDGLQVNSVPQPEQVRRREGVGVSRRFIMQRTA